MQSDGNAVVFDQQRNNIWNSNTASGNGNGPFRLNFLNDGNVVLYKQDLNVFATDTHDPKVSRLTITNDKKLVMYTPDGQWHWSSADGKHCGGPITTWADLIGGKC